MPGEALREHRGVLEDVLAPVDGPHLQVGHVLRQPLAVEREVAGATVRARDQHEHVVGRLRAELVDGDLVVLGRTGRRRGRDRGDPLGDRRIGGRGRGEQERSYKRRGEAPTIRAPALT